MPWKRPVQIRWIAIGVLVLANVFMIVILRQDTSAIQEDDGPPRRTRGLEQTFDLREQVIRNTLQIEGLQRQLDTLQSGGSNEANRTALKVAALERDLDATRNDVTRVWSAVQWMIVFGCAQAATVIYMLVNYLMVRRQPRQRH